MTAILGFFLSPIGRYALGAIGLVGIIGGIYVKGHHDGRVSFKAKVDREIEQSIQKGNDGRADALKQLDAGGVLPDSWFRD
jgi:hypothetical protein